MRKIIGIGAGPSNLSLAALAQNVSDVECVLLERKPQVTWHPGLLFETAGLQVSFLKDLVTPVDPTNPLSFLNFLKTHGRLYQFISAEFDQTLRIEFEAYLKWASAQLNGLFFKTDVCSVTFKDGRFQVLAQDGSSRYADTICVAVGQVPTVPSFAQSLLGRHVLHSSSLLTENPVLQREDVVIVGSGQSAAEVFLACLDGRFGMPSSIVWMSRSPWFRPIDETALTNEIFTPDFVDFFHDLGTAERAALNKELRFTSDGISPVTSRAVMQRLYQNRFLQGDLCKTSLCPGLELVAVKHDGLGITLTAESVHDRTAKKLRADRVILCTGYETRMPQFLDDIRDDMAFENGKLSIDRTYRVQWRLRRSQQLFISNAAMHTHGVPDPNLSLMAYRAATILNATTNNEPIYDLDAEGLVDWAGESANRTSRGDVSQLAAAVGSSAI